MLKLKYLSLLLLFLFAGTCLYAQDIAAGVKLIRNEQYTEAAKVLTAALNNGKTAAEANFYLGEIAMLQNKPDTAGIFYKRGIQADEEFPLNYAGLVKVYITSNSAEAEKNEQEAIDYGDKKEPRVFTTLASAYERAKKFDKAIEMYNQVFKLNPKFGQNYYAQTYIEMGKTYMNMNNGTDAIINFEKALNYDKSNPEAMTRKARVYALINNYDAAGALLEQAIMSDSTYAPAYLEFAELNATRKNYPKAAELYSQYISKSEYNADKEKRYASILYLAKDYPKAIEVSKNVLQRDPGNPYSTRILAYSYLRTEDVDNSIANFQKLFSTPNVEYLTTDYENYSDLLKKTGQDSLAAEYLGKILTIDSTRKDVLGDMSVLYFKMKKWDGVISSLERKGTLTSQEYFDLAKAYYFAQNYAKADSALNILIAKAPDLPVAYFWKARVQANFDPESEQALAQPYYEKFISLVSTTPEKYKKELIEAYSYLGYLHYLKKDNTLSKDYWTKVQELDPENPQALAALKELK